jgi:cobalamin synthase
VMTSSLALWRPARPDGLGARYAAGAQSAWPTVVALALLALIAALEQRTYGGVPRAMLAATTGAASGLAAASWLDRRFGGLTTGVARAS